jgi:3'-phosphoadenosine 5'-phosphosulfate sulfotransferase (PAPS reductase)/FAD synthetase
MSDPFRIDGPAQVGISGGRTSAYLGEQILKAHGGSLPPDVHFTFQNTGRELPQTLEFVDALQKRWGVPLVWLEYDRVYGDLERPRYKIVTFETASRNSEPFDRFLKYYDDYRKAEKDEPPILPNVANRMCSDRMKIKATEWYMRHLGYDDWDTYLGIRADEQIRFHRQMRANEKGGRRWESVMPLYRAGVTKRDVNAYWASQDLDLAIDSDGCFMKHDLKLIRMFQEYPERGVWWINQEQRTGQVFRKDKPTYKQLIWDAEMLLKHPNMDIENIPEDELNAVDCYCGD